MHEEDEELEDGFKMGGSDDDELLDDEIPPEDMDFGLEDEDPDHDR
jgi:hypothetical protein